MGNPLVSVIIPAYNGGEQLGEALQSILNQTYTNLEVIVVDDASPDDMSAVVRGFADPRIRYIKHEKNQGAVAARKTGVHASSGEIIAFLDQDDIFHERKIETHADYLRSNPEIGLSYNRRFEVLGPEKVICGIHRPPLHLGLADWVLGFPVSPSDAVLQREWALLDEIWEGGFFEQATAEHVIFNGQEIVFGGRLALAGCRFGDVGRALNYRRHHPGRVLKHLNARCKAELACQEMILSDPRCPGEVRALRNLAFFNTYLVWAYTAYIQQEFDLGRSFLDPALRLHPAFFSDGDPCQFLNSWLAWVSDGTADSVRGHEEILQSVFENLPQELQHLKGKYDWAVSRSYLLKGLHTMIWRGWDEAEFFLRAAIEKGADVDAGVMNMFSDEILNYGDELGDAAAQKVIDGLVHRLSELNSQNSARSLTGIYAINRAFRDFHAAKYGPVPQEVLQAIRADPRYLRNKGALSVLFRSLLWRTRLTHDPAR